MTELHRILGELHDIDLRLETPGALVSARRDELVARRRSLQARFEGLQQRPDYLSQVDAYTSGLAPRRGDGPSARGRSGAGGSDLAVPA